MIFRLRRSDIVAVRDSDIKDYGFSDILFAYKTCEANITRREPNTTARQYHSPQANKTAQLLYGKLRKASVFSYVIMLFKLRSFYVTRTTQPIRLRHMRHPKRCDRPRTISSIQPVRHIDVSL